MNNFRQHYYLKLVEISMRDKDLNIKGESALIDSGTTVIYLSPSIFDHFFSTVSFSIYIFVFISSFEFKMIFKKFKW